MRSDRFHSRQPSRAPTFSDVRSAIRRQGMALVVVMVTVILVALAAYGFNYQMTEAYRASRMQTDRVQARLAAMSGIDAMLVQLSLPRSQRESFAEDRSTSQGDRLFQQSLESLDRESSADESPGWSFAVISPAWGSPGFGSIAASGTDDRGNGAARGWRFGWTNESAKLNVSMLRRMEQAVPGHARRALSNLPGGTPEIVTAFLRSHGIHSPAGAGRGAFGNGGSEFGGRGSSATWTPSQQSRLWTGGDWDHNYRLDPLEQALSSRADGQGRTGNVLETSTAATSSEGDVVAWRDYVTFHSGQRNANRAGQARIFLNANDLTELHRQLRAIWPEPWADFVILARQFGVSSSSSSSSSAEGEAEEWPAIDLSRPATVRLESVLDLVNARVRIERSGEDPIWRSSPFRGAAMESGDYLERLVDDATTDPNPVLVGQIDIATAPREVLLGVPGMTAEAADRVIQARQTPPPLGGSRDTVAWLVRENVVELSTLGEWLPWITVGGDCVSAQVIGYRDRLSPIFRCTVILDGRDRRGVVREFREWQHWGRGFDLRQFRTSLTTTSGGAFN